MNITQETINNAIKDFLAEGGEIEVLPDQKLPKWHQVTHTKGDALDNPTSIEENLYGSGVSYPQHIQELLGSKHVKRE